MDWDALVAEPRLAGDRSRRVVLGRAEGAAVFGDFGDFAVVILGIDPGAVDRGFDDGAGVGVDRDRAGFGVGRAC